MGLISAIRERRLRSAIRGRILRERLSPLRKLIDPHTLVSPNGIQNLFVLVQRVDKERIPGDVIECGVYKGGTAAVLARVATRSRMGRTVWLFDSFQGMPETKEIDGLEAREWIGKLAADPEEVRVLLRKAGADLRRVKIVAGYFQDTFPAVEIPQIALMHVDADWYDSVKLCLEKFYDSVAPGGFVSFDDYGTWPGCREAVDEFFRNRGLTHPLHPVDHNIRWFQKLPG